MTGLFACSPHSIICNVALVRSFLSVELYEDASMTGVRDPVVGAAGAHNAAFCYYGQTVGDIIKSQIVFW